MQVGRPGAVPPTLGCLLGLPWTNPGQYLQSLLAYSDFLQIKKEREIKRNLKGSSNLCWFEFAGVEPEGMEGQLYNTILYTGLVCPRILVYSGVLEPYPVENCHRLLFFNLSMEEIPFFSI